jgi:hypothetical protein
MDSSNSDTFKASYRNYLVDVGPAEYLFFQNLRVSWRITCLHTSEVNRPSKIAGVTFLSEDALFTTQLTSSSSFFAFILLPVWYVLKYCRSTSDESYTSHKIMASRREHHDLFSLPQATAPAFHVNGHRPDYLPALTWHHTSPSLFSTA